MKHFVVLFCVFLISDCKEEEREPKFFFGPKIQTVVASRRVPEFITEFVPASCVVIDPTLLPCRHVRSLEIYPSIPTRITKTQTPELQNIHPVEPQNWKPPVQGSEASQHTPTPPLRVRPQQVKSPSPHWNWNLFNIFRVENFTYTTTKTEYVTTRVEDPNTVVSFYIKGCRPSRLPFHLPECIRPIEVKEEEKSIVVMAPLKFVPSDSLITPSKPGNLTEIKAAEPAVAEPAVAEPALAVTTAEEEKKEETEKSQETTEHGNQ